MVELIAGVDIGGTNMRIAVATIQQPEVVLAHYVAKTPVAKGPEHYLDLIEEGLSICLGKLDSDKRALAGIGCTVPGITDGPNGIALFVSNLKDWDGYPVAQNLQKRLGIKAVIDNDVNAAALGEYWYGCGKGSHSLVYMTVSTGVAAGIVIEGRLLRGVHHAAGELGFLIPDPIHIGKDWNPNGCLELTSAGVGLVHQWKLAQNGAAKETSAIDVFEAANAGNDRAHDIVSKASDYLAQTAVAICTVIDPEILVMSGSIAQHQPFVLNRIRDVVKETIPYAPEVVLSTLKGDAPLIGALALIARSIGT